MKDLGKKVYSSETPSVDRIPLIALYRFYAQYLRTSAASLGLSAVFLVFSTFTYLARPWPLKIVVDHVILDRSSKRSASRALPALSAWLAAFDRSTLLWIACIGVIVIAVLYGIFDYYHNLLVAQAAFAELPRPLQVWRPHEPADPGCKPDSGFFDGLCSGAGGRGCVSCRNGGDHGGSRLASDPAAVPERGSCDLICGHPLLKPAPQRHAKAIGKRKPSRNDL